MSLWQYIEHWDKMFFLLIHLGAVNTFFDWLLPYLRIPQTWIPVYLLLFYFAVKTYGIKNAALWALTFIVVFAICDFVSASIFKPLFARSRPCNDVLLKEFIRPLVQCGSGYSFPSAHSSNHFGMSFFIIFTLGKKYAWAVPLVFLWACAVVFAQVYVGVHFPLDILAGSFIGTVVAFISAYYFNLQKNSLILK